MPFLALYVGVVNDFVLLNMENLIGILLDDHFLKKFFFQYVS